MALQNLAEELKKPEFLHYFHGTLDTVGYTSLETHGEVAYHPDLTERRFEGGADLYIRKTPAEIAAIDKKIEENGKKITGLESRIAGLGFFKKKERESLVWQISCLKTESNSLISSKNIDPESQIYYHAHQQIEEKYQRSKCSLPAFEANVYGNQAGRSFIVSMAYKNQRSGDSRTSFNVYCIAIPDARKAEIVEAIRKDPDVLVKLFKEFYSKADYSQGRLRIAKDGVHI
jgi:hypothetical protein